MGHTPMTFFFSVGAYYFYHLTRIGYGGNDSVRWRGFFVNTLLSQQGHFIYFAVPTGTHSTLHCPKSTLDCPDGDNFLDVAFFLFSFFLSCFEFFI